MKYVLGVLGFVILTIVAIVLIATTTSNRGGGRQVGEQAVQLTEFTDTPAVVTFVEQGRIVAAEDYREIRIMVSSSERRVEVIQGYEGEVLRSQTFPGSSGGFETFLHALSEVGFTREKETEVENPQGVCPLGRRYLYQLREGSETVLSLWNTSCNRRLGNFGGDTGTVRQLFHSQIPDYRQFVSDVRL